MLNKMTQQNASRFAIFWEYENKNAVAFISVKNQNHVNSKMKKWKKISPWFLYSKNVTKF